MNLATHLWDLNTSYNPPPEYFRFEYVQTEIWYRMRGHHYKMPPNPKPATLETQFGSVFKRFFVPPDIIPEPGGRVRHLACPEDSLLPLTQQPLHLTQIGLKADLL